MKFEHSRTFPRFSDSRFSESRLNETSHLRDQFLDFKSSQTLNFPNLLQFQSYLAIAFPRNFLNLVRIELENPISRKLIFTPILITSSKLQFSSNNLIQFSNFVKRQSTKFQTLSNVEENLSLKYVSTRLESIASHLCTRGAYRPTEIGQWM